MGFLGSIYSLNGRKSAERRFMSSDGRFLFSAGRSGDAVVAGKMAEERVGVLLGAPAQKVLLF